MKLLVVNPNTDDATTDRIRRAALAAARPGTEIEAVTAPFGVHRIKNPAQSARAGEAVVAAIAVRAHATDCAVVAAFSDPGLARARERFRFPVVGIAEASMLEAAARADRFSIVALATGMAGRYRQLAADYGVAGKLASIRFVAGAAETATADELADAIAEECRRAAAEDGAEAVVIGGGPLSGVAERIAAGVPIPVVEGVPASVRRAERLAGGG